MEDRIQETGVRRKNANVWLTFLSLDSDSCILLPVEYRIASLETDGRGFIKVNERLETNVPGVYALSDVS